MDHVLQRPKHRTSLPSGGQTALHQGKRKGNPHCVEVPSQRCVWVSLTLGITWFSDITGETCCALAAFQACALAHVRRTGSARHVEKQVALSCSLLLPHSVT